MTQPNTPIHEILNIPLSILLVSNLTLSPSCCFLQVEEISTAINYIRSSITRSPTSPVVLMGHSTGCQDLMHYLVSEVPPKTKAKTNTKNNQSTSASASASRPTISGAIFQAPVSDREAIMRDVNDDPPTRESYESCLSIAASTPEDKHATTILPLHVSRLCLGPAPLSIKRFLSLASPGSPENPGMDDYFSSDLTDRRLVDTFGRIGAAAHLQVSKRQHDDNKSSDDVGSGKTVLFLPSGSDEHVPSTIDKALLLSRWKRAIESRGAAASLSPHSQIIPNALHDISGPSVEARTARLIDMRGAVLRYLDDVVGDIDGETGSTAPAAAAQTHPGPWTIYHRDQQAIELERGVGGVRL